MNFKKGDFVTRRSYNSDIVFKIEKIKEQVAILRSFRIRLMADAPLDDLIKLSKKEVKSLKKELMLECYDCLQRQQKHLALNNRQLRGTSSIDNCYQEHLASVLHLDGDKNYLELSLANYSNLNIRVKGFFIPEKGQPENIGNLVREHRPDILVITGHDGELNGTKYHTSDYFVEAVQKAREVIPDLDSLVIFAGACQSDYNRLISSGANYASSPENKLIHFLDPLLIVEKIIFTSIREVIPVKDVIKNTITGVGGIGGLETRGKLRLRYPQC
jgi:spore coat assembly protein